MTRRLKLGQVKASSPSSAYIGFYPLQQATSDTTLVDRSGKGNHGTIGSLTIGEAWAVGNCLSSLNTSGKAAYLAAGIMSARWDKTKSLLISVRANVSKEGAIASLWGSGAGGVSHSGLAMRVSTTGQVALWGYKSDGTSSASGSTTETPFSATAGNTIATYADIVAAYDGPARTLLIYIDGVRAANYASPVDMSSIILLTDDFQVDPFYLGARTGADTIAGCYQFWHILAKDGALPANIDQIAWRLRRNPSVALTETEFPA